MLFNSLAYMIFLPVVVALFWLTPFKFRTPLLLVASYVFYCFWKPIYGVLIFSMTVMNYVFGLLIARSEKNKGKWLALALVGNLVTLGYFKYTYMTRDVLNDVFQAIGLHQLPSITWEIILPLGISFFVFEFIHYLVDVYRGDKPVKNFLEFALFPSFFPTQIAGPIKRYQDFIPQLRTEHKLTREEFNSGVELIVFGLFKKVVLADTVGVLVARAYAHPDLLTGADLWLATWGFAWQVFFDFGGYSDIARGSAQLMGLKVPLNFSMPYLSGNYSDFWRRWHITLSMWLKDYLFIPLGGSRCSEPRIWFNLIVTMALAGLWHGAGMHFVVYGVYVGICLALHRAWKNFVATSQFLTKIQGTKLYHWFSIVVTFNVHCFGLVYFRALNVKSGTITMLKMLNLQPAAEGLANWQPAIMNTQGSMIYPIIPFALLTFWIFQVLFSRSKETPGILPTPRWFPAFKPVYLAVLIALLFIFSPDVTPAYIYFQF